MLKSPGLACASLQSPAGLSTVGLRSYELGELSEGTSRYFAAHAILVQSHVLGFGWLPISSSRSRFALALQRGRVTTGVKSEHSCGVTSDVVEPKEGPKRKRGANHRGSVSRPQKKEKKNVGDAGTKVQREHRNQNQSQCQIQQDKSFHAPLPPTRLDSIVPY